MLLLPSRGRRRAVAARWLARLGSGRFDFAHDVVRRDPKLNELAKVDAAVAVAVERVERGARFGPREVAAGVAAERLELVEVEPVVVVRVVPARMVSRCITAPSERAEQAISHT